MKNPNAKARAVGAPSRQEALRDEAERMAKPSNPQANGPDKLGGDAVLKGSDEFFGQLAGQTQRQIKLCQRSARMAQRMAKR